MVKADVFVLGNSEKYKELDFEYTFRIPAEKITLHTFNVIKRMSKSPYFYIVKESANTNIDFSQEVYEYENAFVFWNGDDSVRLFNAEKVFENPAAYTDEEWWAGNITDVYNIIDDNVAVNDAEHVGGNIKSKCQVVLLGKGWNDWKQKLSSIHYPILHVDSDSLDEEGIEYILSNTNKPVIYIVRCDVDCNGLFQLDYVPPHYDDKYMHVWNNNLNVVCIVRKQLMSRPELYTDVAIANGKAPVKHMTDDDFVIHEENTGAVRSKDKCMSVFLYNGWAEWCDRLSSKFWPFVHIKSNCLGEVEIEKILAAANDNIETIYIVRNDVELGEEFEPSFIFHKHDRKYMHVWNDNCNLIAISKSVLKSNPSLYTDDALKLNNTPIKNHTSTSVKHNAGSFLDAGVYNDDACCVVLMSPTWEDWCEDLSKEIRKTIYVKSNMLSLEQIHKILACVDDDTEMLYFVRDKVEMVGEFQLNWVPSIYDSEYLHIWNGNTNLCGVTTRALKQNPQLYTDDSLRNETVDFKLVSDPSVIVSGSLTKDMNMFGVFDKSKCSYVFLTEDWMPWCDKMSKKVWPVLHIDSHELGEKEIQEILAEVNTEYVYVFSADVETDGFEFDYIPPVRDNRYIHIWNNSFDMRLMSVDELRKDPKLFTDDSIKNGAADVKNYIAPSVVIKKELDIVFLSYNEPSADENYQKLLKRFPRAKRVHGVEGIFNAHKTAAKLAKTDMFYVVDADAIILDSFDFSYVPSIYDKNCVHVWRSVNPCNNLQYGYGGVKLFPRNKLIEAKTWGTDFTTSLGTEFKPMGEISNITAFNVDAFSAWRSGFREAAKLASKTIDRQLDAETDERLNVWCTVKTDAPFSEECVHGALQGKEYGLKHKNDLEALKKINDYNWLKEQYENRTSSMG